MNDQDYVKAGVELADGWSFSAKRTALMTPGGYFGSLDDQEIQDALAAQLWRQFDVHPDDCWLELSTSGNCARAWCDIKEEPLVFGDNRTMTIIKAIVDSGKLK